MTVADARFAKPIDAGLMAQLAAEHDLLVTVEEGVLAGGFGSAVWETLNETGARAARGILMRVGLPDRYVTHGKPALLHEEVGFTGKRIAERVAAAIADRELSPDRRPSLGSTGTLGPSGGGLQDRSESCLGQVTCATPATERHRQRCCLRIVWRRVRALDETASRLGRERAVSGRRDWACCSLRGCAHVIACDARVAARRLSSHGKRVWTPCWPSAACSPRAAARPRR